MSCCGITTRDVKQFFTDRQQVYRDMSRSQKRAVWLKSGAVALGLLGAGILGSLLFRRSFVIVGLFAGTVGGLGTAAYLLRPGQTKERIVEALDDAKAEVKQTATGVGNWFSEKWDSIFGSGAEDVKMKEVSRGTAPVAGGSKTPKTDAWRESMRQKYGIGNGE